MFFINKNVSLKSKVLFQGEQVFQALLAAGAKRKVTIRIAQNWPTRQYPNVDTQYLVKKKAAQVSIYIIFTLLHNLLRNPVLKIILIFRVPT